MTRRSESGPALMVNEPPQHRPVLMRPSPVKRKIGRLCSLPSLIASRMSVTHPISSKRLSSGDACRSSTVSSTQRTTLASGIVPSVHPVKSPTIAAATSGLVCATIASPPHTSPIDDLPAAAPGGRGVHTLSDSRLAVQYHGGEFEG